MPKPANSATIKEYGIAQPIVVTYDEHTKTYEVVAGERPPARG